MVKPHHIMVKPHHIMTKPHNDKTTPRNGETTSHNDETTSCNNEWPHKKVMAFHNLSCTKNQWPMTTAGSSEVTGRQNCKYYVQLIEKLKIMLYIFYIQHLHGYCNEPKTKGIFSICWDQEASYLYILITVPANTVSNLSRNCNNGVSSREYIEKLKDKSENEITKNSTEWWEKVFKKWANERNLQPNVEEYENDVLDQRSSQV